jgi:hypothetical protein
MTIVGLHTGRRRGLRVLETVGTCIDSFNMYVVDRLSLSVRTYVQYEYDRSTETV